MNRTIMDVLAPLWDGAVNDTPPSAVADALATACEDSPLVDGERGIAVVRFDPNELHQVELRDDGWTILHPLRERLDGSLFDCELDWSSGDIGVRGRYWLDIRGRLGGRVDDGDGQ